MPLPRDWLDRVEVEPPESPPVVTWNVTIPDTGVFTALRGQWVRAAESVTTSFTVAGRALAGSLTGRLTDRGEDDRVSDPFSNDLVIDAHAEAYPEDTGPFRLTRATLQELGSCGPYVRTFSSAFPQETYPDGIEITQEVCAQHYRDFDWSWAESRLLNDSGRQVYTTLLRSRSEENRRFGTGDRRRAAIFGHVFATRPELRHTDLATIRSAAARRADQDAIRDVQRTRSDIETYEREIDRYQRALESAREKLPLLEANSAGALRRVAATRVRELETQHRRMLERAAKGQEAVEQAKAELDRLIALETEQEAKKAAEVAEAEANLTEVGSADARIVQVVAHDPTATREPSLVLQVRENAF